MVPVICGIIGTVAMLFALACSHSNDMGGALTCAALAIAFLLTAGNLAAESDRACADKPEES